MRSRTRMSVLLKKRRESGSTEKNVRVTYETTKVFLARSRRILSEFYCEAKSTSQMGSFWI